MCEKDLDINTAIFGYVANEFLPESLYGKDKDERGFVCICPNCGETVRENQCVNIMPDDDEDIEEEDEDEEEDPANESLRKFLRNNEIK